MRTDVKEPHISGIVNCQKPISVSFAKKLQYVLEVDASFWINLQANYEKELADFDEINRISHDELAILKKLKCLTKYARNNHLIDPDAQDSLLVIEWRKLLNVSTLVRIPEISQTGAYRLAVANNVDSYILFTWLRMCDLITNNQPAINQLDIDKLKSKLYTMRNLTFEDLDTIHSKLKEHFAECGIKFALVKHFAGAPVQGVITKNRDGSLNLIMTLRRKFADVFWFTLFHEIAHILNGDIDDRLIDYEDTKSQIEDRADIFAANVLIAQEDYDAFVGKDDYSLPSIHRFCAEQCIPIFIVIGRLQRDNHLGYNHFIHEKIKYEMD
jgi:HTH-type transcriptional regulator / antitoxin HigA